MMVPPFDIAAEHGRCDSLTDRDLAWLRERGVPPGALIKTALGQWSVIARDTVAFHGRRFEFCRHRGCSEPVVSFVWPAHDEFGEVVDLIAWRPPATVATWLGRVGLAGEELLAAARFGEPLMVYETVLGWLRAGREGVVVVDPVRAASLLRTAGTLAVATVAERRRLQALLTVRAPRIEVVNRDSVPVDLHNRPTEVLDVTRTLYGVQDSALWTETTGRGQGMRTDLVDNINEVPPERPTGTSREAGLRSLQKHAEVAL